MQQTQIRSGFNWRTMLEGEDEGKLSWVIVELAAGMVLIYCRLKTLTWVFNTCCILFLVQPRKLQHIIRENPVISE